MYIWSLILKFVSEGNIFLHVKEWLFSHEPLLHCYLIIRGWWVWAEAYLAYMGMQLFTPLDKILWLRFTMVVKLQFYTSYNTLSQFWGISSSKLLLQLSFNLSDKCSHIQTNPFTKSSSALLWGMKKLIPDAPFIRILVQNSYFQVHNFMHYKNKKQKKQIWRARRDIV